MSYVSRTQARSPDLDSKFAHNILSRVLSYLPFMALPLYLVGVCIAMFIPTTAAEGVILAFAILSALANTVYFSFVRRIRHKVVLSFHLAVGACFLSLPLLLLAYMESHHDKGLFALRLIALLFFILLFLRELLFLTLERNVSVPTSSPRTETKPTSSEGKRPYTYRGPKISHLIWKRHVANKKAQSPSTKA